MLPKVNEQVCNRWIFLILATFVSLFLYVTIAKGQGIDSSSIIPPDSSTTFVLSANAIRLSAYGSIRLTILSTETSSLEDELGLESPSGEVFTTNARNCVGCTWERGPFRPPTELVFYLKNRNPKTGPGQETVYPDISGEYPSWILGFEDWYDMDYNDVVCKVEFLPCTVDMDRMEQSYFNQNQWASEPYDNVPDKTIGSSGCLLTCCAMLLQYYDVATGLDGLPVNPVNLNNWLKEHNGYQYDGTIIYDQIATYSGHKISYVGTYQPNDDALALNHLCLKRPIILVVNRDIFGPDSGHAVVATGSTMAGYIPTWSISDPDHTNNEDLTRYRNNYQQMIIFEPKSGSSTLYIGGWLPYKGSPVELYITDPVGRHSGFDPSSGSLVQEIPESIYDRVQIRGLPIDNIFHQWHPIAGMYCVTVIGIDNSQYYLDVYSYGEEGLESSARAAGTAHIGMVEQYVIEYTPAPGSTVKSYQQVAVQSLPPKWYLSWLYSPQGVIKCYIGNLHEGYDADQVLVSSIRLNDTVPVLGADYQILPSYPDFTGEVLVVSFDRKLALESLGDVEVGNEYPVNVRGELQDGPRFFAETTVRIEQRPGAIVGIVSDSLGGLLGVTMDLSDSTNTLIRTTVSDQQGNYSFDELYDGLYSVSAVSPLGFMADAETKSIVVTSNADSVLDFSLARLGFTPSPRSRAYWAHQLHKALQNKPDDYTVGDFSRFAGLINLHFNQNQVNPVDFYTVPQPATQQDSLMELKKLLHMCQGNGDPFLKRFAKAQLMALMLNVVSGKISQTEEISEDGRTVSQAVTYCDMLVNEEIDCPDGVPGHGSPLCRYILADFILTFANLGLTVPENLIPEDVMEIAYRIHNQERLPDGFGLHQNYPNPFNPECEIAYDLPKDCYVTLSIYNILGQKVKVLVDEYQSTGNKSVKWDGKDDQGQEVTSGVYFYRIQAGDFSLSKKMVLLR